jgi:hypothetical protein
MSRGRHRRDTATVSPKLRLSQRPAGTQLRSRRRLESPRDENDYWDKRKAAAERPLGERVVSDRDTTIASDEPSTPLASPSFRGSSVHRRCMQKTDGSWPLGRTRLVEARACFRTFRGRGTRRIRRASRGHTVKGHPCPAAGQTWSDVVRAHAGASLQSRVGSRRQAKVQRRVVGDYLPEMSLGSATARARSAEAAPVDACLRGGLANVSPRSAVPPLGLLREPAASTFAGPPPRRARPVPRASRRLPSSCSLSREGPRSGATARESFAVYSTRSLGTAPPRRAIAEAAEPSRLRICSWGPSLLLWRLHERPFGRVLSAAADARRIRAAAPSWTIATRVPARTALCRSDLEPRAEPQQCTVRPHPGYPASAACSHG